MLKPVNRLTKKKDFDRVFNTGRSNFNKLAGVKVIKNDLPQSRFGIVVSTKVSKKAVERNRIKRQIRAIISQCLPMLKVGLDCAIIARPAIIGEKYPIIEKSLVDNFMKLRLYITSHTLKLNTNFGNPGKSNKRYQPAQ